MEKDLETMTFEPQTLGTKTNPLSSRCHLPRAKGPGDEKSSDATHPVLSKHGH